MSLKRFKFDLTALVLSGSLSVLALFAPWSFADQVAAGPQPAADPSFPWTAGDYQDCGQACHYKKANEQVMSEADYIVKKIEVLKMVLKKDPRIPLPMIQNQPATPDEVIFATLGDFCFRDNNGDPTELSAACLERYSALAMVHVLKIRKAAVQNDTMVAKLEDTTNEAFGQDAPGLGKSRPVIKMARSAKSLKKSHSTYVPTYDQLLATAQAEQVNHAQLKKADYDAWVDEATTLEAADVPTIKPVIGDPASPSARKNRRVDFDNQGKIKPDLAAFADVQQRYSKSTQVDQPSQKRGDLKTKLDDYKKAMKAKAQSTIDLANKKGSLQALKASKVKTAAPWTSETVDLRKFIWNQIRGDIVTFTNVELAKISQGSSGPSRPAGTNGNIAQPGAFFSGIEKVNEIERKPADKGAVDLFIDASPDYYGTGEIGVILDP